MIPVITYLLCVYLIFKGVEIFQIAYMSNRENRTGGLIVGNRRYKGQHLLCSDICNVDHEYRGGCISAATAVKRAIRS
jgi:hypothetical protein